jgi:predicted nucleic acid-binding Zn ribbon protein
MPSYDYICTNQECKKKFNFFCSSKDLNENKPKECDACGGKIDMDASQMGRIGIVWKCSGAYGGGGETKG